MFRRLAVAAFALALLVLNPVAAGAATTTGGTAETTLSLAELTLEGLPVPIDGLSLGALRSFASTDDDTAHNALGSGKPFALAALNLPVVGNVEVRSDGTTTAAGQDVALPGGLGTLKVGQMAAEAGDGKAQSLINALSGDVAVALAGLTARVPATGVTSAVDGDVARATNGAVLENVGLRLGDLLPLDLLQQLPLDVLVDLIDSLGLGDLPVDLDELVSTLRQLVNDLGAVQTLNTAIDDTQDRLDDLDTGLADAQAAVSGLETAVADLRTALRAAEGDASAVDRQRAAVRSQLSDVRGDLAAVGAAGDALQPSAALCGQSSLCRDVDQVGSSVDALDAQVDAIDAQLVAADQQLNDPGADLEALATQLEATLGDLGAAQDLVGTLNRLIDAAQATLNTLLTQIDALLDEIVALLEDLDVTNLSALLDQLLEGLAAGEILAVDEIVVGVDTAARAADSTATALCRVEGVRVLGVAREIDTCAQLQGVLGEVTALIEGLLADLPVVSNVLPEGTVTVKGLTTSASPANQREGDYSVATASISALDLQILPVELKQVTDAVVSEVTLLVDGALADLSELTGVDPAVVEQLQAQLEALLGQLEALPTGALLKGVKTPKVALNALGLTAKSTFKTAGSAGAPVDPPAQAQPPAQPPAQVVPSTNLPRTGAGLGGFALLLLGTGGTALYTLRGRRRA
jgi:hypothetical protein